ncbi:unnamed protein product [Adineta steineri]|uniref:Uncharacterized protein n=1 Tax=Adineta steineri TaxID=433720 RepID=A0A814L110_9BILA|nr:unnamed protein product [Adineta steineri]CAF1059517.1 unnamed protein product [Adineta steineri]CAF1163413.1 unnamed protein product [Adineta steineri]CAF3793890.1 unnamed protein product [Adineta steineri]CAF4108517.1 unnamed protein product [Adineta steineri]
MNELEEKNKASAHDIRIFTTKEITLASNLRPITDTFQHQANRFRQQQYCSLLKQLKEDPSIMITRPDK